MISYALFDFLQKRTEGVEVRNTTKQEEGGNDWEPDGCEESPTAGFIPICVRERFYGYWESIKTSLVWTDEDNRCEMMNNAQPQSSQPQLSQPQSSQPQSALEKCDRNEHLERELSDNWTRHWNNVRASLDHDRSKTDWRNISRYDSIDAVYSSSGYLDEENVNAGETVVQAEVLDQNDDDTTVLPTVDENAGSSKHDDITPKQEHDKETGSSNAERGESIIGLVVDNQTTKDRELEGVKDNGGSDVLPRCNIHYQPLPPTPKTSTTHHPSLPYGCKGEVEKTHRSRHRNNSKHNKQELNIQDTGEADIMVNFLGKFSNFASFSGKD